MLNILQDCPLPGFKFYMDILLKRYSSVPEIDSSGLKLSAEVIRKEICSFKPVLKEMEENYLKNMSFPVPNIHYVSISLNHLTTLQPWALLFLRAILPGTGTAQLPFLLDIGASNSAVSLQKLSTLGVNTSFISQDVQYLLSNCTELDNSVLSYIYWIWEYFNQIHSFTLSPTLCYPRQY